MSSRGLLRAAAVFAVFAVLFVALFLGVAHSISILSQGTVPETYRRGFDSEIRLLRLTTAGSAICSLALGACIATIYFLWRAASSKQNGNQPLPR